MLSNVESVETKLQRIAEKARRDPKCRFTSLFHLMNMELLRGCFEWYSYNGYSEKRVIGTSFKEVPHGPETKELYCDTREKKENSPIKEYSALSSGEFVAEVAREIFGLKRCIIGVGQQNGYALFIK